MSDDIDRRCQAHEDRDAVARVISTSVAGTPLIHDACEECLSVTLSGFQMFGLPPGTEIEWFEEVPELEEAYEQMSEWTMEGNQ